MDDQEQQEDKTTDEVVGEQDNDVSIDQQPEGNEEKDEKEQSLKTTTEDL